MAHTTGLIANVSALQKETCYPEFKKEEYPGDPKIDRNTYEEKKARWNTREERKKERYNREVQFLKKFFPLRIEGIIVELITQDEYAEGTEYEEYTSIIEYRKMTNGAEVFDEETLIIGKGEESVCLVFKKEEEGKIKNRELTDRIYVLDELDFNQNSVIHKLFEPAKLPEHLRPLIVINNVVNSRIGGGVGNINLDSLTISKGGNPGNRIRGGLFNDFIERNYKPGGMCSLKEMKSHPEWKNEYRNKLEVKKVNICKSRKKCTKGCCRNYRPTNRKVLLMVIGCSCSYTT